MATSPIYNWPEPDNSDLVKNGALAIRTLGNAIDTTMATMVPKSIVDAKGDLIAGTAADTAARLAVGNNGETLVADSSTATGLRYQGNYAAGKNAIINGAFDVWQRGTSISLSNAVTTYTSDRWAVYSGFSAGTSSFSRQTFTPGAAPVAGYEGQYFARLTCGSTASYVQIEQRIENVQTFAGQTVTFSFWAKASTTVTLATFAAQVFGSGGSSQVTTNGANASVTTSWTRFTTTIAIPSISGKTIGTSSYLALAFGSGANLNSTTIDIWGVQLEAGSVATAFQTATGTIQGELAACQRYYVRNTYGTAYGSYCLGYATSTTNVYALISLPVPMRVMPTSIDYANLCLDLSGQAIFTISSLAGSQSTTYAYGVNVGSTGLTQHRVYDLANNNNTAGYLGFSAEL